MKRARAWVLALAVLPALPVSSAFAVDTGELAAARAAVDRHDYAAALPIYSALVAADGTNADLLIEAARVNGFADRNREAAALYRRVIEVAPDRRADVLPSLAWQTLWAGDAPAAAALFEELTTGGRDRADAFDGLGQARLAQDDPRGAEAAFRDALALRPGDAALRKRLARALLWSDRPDEAAAVLEAVHQGDPNDREAAWMLATAYSFADRQAAALAVFSAAGAPVNDGERFDLARTWAWAGFEDRAAPLLAGQSGAEAAWLRDWRVRREEQRYVFGNVEHAIDRDRLESLAVSLGGGWHLHGGDTFELKARHGSLTDASGAPSFNELQALYRWRLGSPLASSGTLWPTLALRTTRLGDWSPVTGLARLTWLPQDGWRVDAEAARDFVDTPTAVRNRVTVDAWSVGADRRFGTRFTGTAALALLRFDDGNHRTRVNGRLEYALGLRPRWTVGVEAMAFESSRPTSATAPARGYWNPERYDEERVFTALRWERRPWDVYARLALGTSRETDGDGTRTHGRPNLWEIGIGHDFSPTLRATLALSGSGSSAGFSGGSGYWRRTASIGLIGWF